MQPSHATGAFQGAGASKAAGEPRRKRTHSHIRAQRASVQASRDLSGMHACVQTQTLAPHAVAHEAGHALAARSVGAQLQPPFLIPAGLGIIGSFGAVTGVRGTLRNREELLKIAAAGPAAGTALSLALVLLGLGLSVAKAGPLVEVWTWHPGGHSALRVVMARLWRCSARRQLSWRARFCARVGLTHALFNAWLHGSVAECAACGDACALQCGLMPPCRQPAVHAIYILVSAHGTTSAGYLRLHAFRHCTPLHASSHCTPLHACSRISRTQRRTAPDCC
jgi:hypothetical protein